MSLGKVKVFPIKKQPIIWEQSAKWDSQQLDARMSSNLSDETFTSCMGKEKRKKEKQ